MLSLPARVAAAFRLSCTAILVSGCVVSAAAQQPSKSQASLPRTIVLPQKLLAGDPATLAVLDGTGRMMSGTVVELSTGQKVTTDGAGRALFVAPSEPGTMTAKISGREIPVFSTT